MSFYFLDIKPLTFTKEFLYKYMKRDPPALHSPLAWGKAGGMPGNAVPAPGRGSSATPGCSCPEHSGFVWCEEPSSGQSHHGVTRPRRCQGSWSRRCPWKWAWPKTLRVPPAQRAPKTKAEAMLSFQHRPHRQNFSPSNVVTSVSPCRLLRNISHIP